MTFLEKVANGQSSLDLIDDAVEEWHKSDRAVSLPEHLGMTEYEFGLWIKDARVLKIILAAKKKA